LFPRWAAGREIERLRRRILVIVGIPKEIKDQEYRVAATPMGVAELTAGGHTVLIQTGSGGPSGFTDEEYSTAGAQLTDDPARLYAQADMIVKVKEPQESEHLYLRQDQIVFGFLGLVTHPGLVEVLLERRVTAIAYDTVQLPDGSIPLMAAMSEISGKLAIQVGAHYLERTQGGLGLLLGGVTGVSAGRAVVLGGGVVGMSAVKAALAMGVHVILITRNQAKLSWFDGAEGGFFEVLEATPGTIAEAVRKADLAVGAVLVPGGATPKLVTRQMVSAMRPGSVVVDVSVDRGGCFETTRPTSHSDPVYEIDGVVHYCVPNMPGAVPRTATQALCNATLPYVLALANDGVDAVRTNAALALGVNTLNGGVTNEALADALGLSSTPALDALGN
jgi:alanine dehydrogenase